MPAHRDRKCPKRRWSEHDGHEKIGPEEANRRQPAQFEDEQAKQGVDGAVKSQKSGAANFFKGSADESAAQEKQPDRDQIGLLYC